MNRGVDPGLLEPCGTPAAARRHRRRHEPLCEACRQAERTRRGQRDGFTGGAQSSDTRQIRNGLPWKPYAYRGSGPFLHEEEDECA
jgi:hypothetical protein